MLLEDAVALRIEQLCIERKMTKRLVHGKRCAADHAYFHQEKAQPLGSRPFTPSAKASTSPSPNSSPPRSSPATPCTTEEGGGEDGSMRFNSHKLVRGVFRHDAPLFGAFLDAHYIPSKTE